MDDVMTGRVCITKQGHEALKANELSFERGDVVTIVSELLEDGEHYQAASTGGDIGIFPASAILARRSVPMIPMPWFHSGISRMEAEKLLDWNQDGQYLLRTSQNTKGVYALAFSYKGRVTHYLVAMDLKNRKLTFNGRRYFDNLPSLVKFYSTHSEELSTSLTHPVIKRGSLDFHINLELLKKTWGLPAGGVEVGQMIGQGEFGEVHTAVYRGLQVAVKAIHDSKQTAATVASFLREATIMTELRHKNLVQLIGLVFQGAALKSIVMELMGKGSLQKYLISRGRSVISQTELLSFARDVCAGMCYISSHGFVHRDLAARNVLLNSNGEAKVSDFGLTRKADIHVPHEGGKFPVKWTAPEALKESKFTVMSDVWSFGVFLWELYSFGRTPYPSIPADEVLANLEDGIVMDPPDSASNEVYDMMCSCWEMEPGDRPSFPTLMKMLAKPLGQSRAVSSRSVAAMSVAVVPDVDELVSGPVAAKAYREAPLTRKSTTFFSNIVFLGPVGSGKTSLLRNLTGQPFRLMEPATLSIATEESYRELRDDLTWVPSTSGLMYEDELIRIITEDLLKHIHSVLVSKSTDSTPPLPPIRKRRSLSFSDVHHSSGILTNSDTEATKATQRLSGSYEVLESGSPEGKLQLGVRPQPLAATSPRGMQRSRKSFIGRILSKNFKGKDKAGGSVKRHYSDSVKRSHFTRPTGVDSDGDTRPKYYSVLPERLMDKIKMELKDCSTGVLPPKYFGKLIDVPGNPAFRVLKPLFITETSLCVLVFDASRDMFSVPSPSVKRKSSVGVRQNGVETPSPTSVVVPNPGDTYLAQLVAEINDVCLHWAQSNADMSLRGARIVLVATHSDKVPSSVSHRNFELLQEALKGSAYEKYISMAKFIVSSSSIIERSSSDDVKHFMMELVKKACRQQVPLHWLRCVRRFQGLSKKGVYFLSLVEARKIVGELCDIPDPEEINNVINFLHQNQVILHFQRIYQIKELVITSPKWFSRQVSAVFTAPSIDLLQQHDELQSDQELLRSKGILTNQLLEFVWREKDARLNKDELLTLMHKMDLLCCMANESKPVSPTASVEDLTKDTSAKKHQVPKLVVSSVIVPALIEESKPPCLDSLPMYNAEPLYFQFKEGFVPSGFFPRLLARCVQSYPSNFSIYQDCATFEVDTSSLLMLTTGKDHVRVSLHRIRENTASPSLLTSLSSTNIDTLLSESNDPNPDTCMAVLMFVQAAVNNLMQQWTPHLDYNLCIGCSCNYGQANGSVDIDEVARKADATRSISRQDEKHYVVLNDMESLLQRSFIRCELGSQVTTSSAILCWFGEAPVRMTSSPTEDSDLMSDEDIEVVAGQLGASWAVLGQMLGFTRTELEHFSLGSPSVRQTVETMLREWQILHRQNATFFTLLGALEIIQRRDIADDLVAFRMAGDGINL